MKRLHPWKTWRRSAAALALATTASAGGVIVTPGLALAAGLHSFSAGVLQPGQIRHMWWNNANADAYAVGLEVTKVKEFEGCGVEISRTWFEREVSGEREFHMQIKGSWTSACEVRVWLADLASYRSSFTGDLAPGDTWDSHWNNAHTDQYVYAVGVVGSQPASGTCRMEVATHYRTQPTGENEFYYAVTNIGSTTCSAELRHVRLPVQWSFAAGNLSAGHTRNISPSTFNETARAFVPGVVPGTTSAGECRYDLSPVSYGDTGRIDVDYTNAGTVACAMTSTFTGL